MFGDLIKEQIAKKVIKELNKTKKNNNKITKKVNEITKRKTIGEIELDDKKNYMILKNKWNTVKGIIKSIAETYIFDSKENSTFCKITDLNNHCKYHLKYDETNITRKSEIYLFKKSKKVGKIKETLLSSNNKKEYILELEEKKLGKFYVHNRDYLEIHDKLFTTGNYIQIKLKYKEENKLKKAYYEITKDNVLIGKIYLIGLYNDNDYLEKYLIEYDDVKNESLVALIAATLDLTEVY